MNYVFIELPRFRKALQQKSAVAEKWAFVFNNITRLREVPGELSEKYFRKLFESAKIANFTGEEQLSYIESQKMKCDYENVLEYAVEQAAAKAEKKGREEGEAKGKEEGISSIVAKLLQSGMTAETIAKATGLPLETVLSYCR